MSTPLFNRPSPGTSTGRVWDIADELSRQSGRQAKRAEVIARYRDEGGNYNTASTQYHYWKAHFERERTAAGEAEMPHEVVNLQVKDAGRILLPAVIRQALHIREGDVLSAEVVGGEIRLTPLDTAVRRAQELVRRYIPEGSGLVDELLADRRREAEAEADDKQ